MRKTHLLIGTLIASVYATTAVSEEAKTAPVITDQAPKRSFIRWNEDWSNYNQGDYKHVNLNSSGSVWASFGGHVRFRNELWDNFVFNDEFDDGFLLGRATVHADVHLGNKWRVFTELKTANSTDRALPGGRRPLDVDTFALQQAFVEYKFGNNEIKVGRQELSFGAQRLVSPLPWGNALRTWQGVRVDNHYKGWTSTAFATEFVPVRQYDTNRPDDNQKFSGFHTQGKISKWSSSFYLFNLNGNDARDVNTIGSRWVRNEPTWDLDIEVSGQFGSDSQDNDISAFSFASLLGFKIKHDVLKKVFVGLDVASGDDDPFDDDTETFDQLFPLGHAYLGFADFIGRRNITAIHAGANFKLSPKVSARAAIHSFYKTEDEDAIYNAGGGVLRAGNENGFGSDHIGNELDLTLNYAINRNLAAQFGLVYFQTGDAIEETGSDANARFAYWQLNYVF